MREGLVLRPFHPSDQTAVQTLILHGLSEYFDEIRPEFNPDLNDIQRNYVDRGALFLVAACHGRIVGTGALVPETAVVGRIVRVSVDHDWRRQGLGRRLVTRLLDAARDRGCTAVVVETNDDWTSAIALYRAFGFQTEARHSGEIHMRLDLTHTHPPANAAQQ